MTSRWRGIVGYAAWMGMLTVLYFRLPGVHIGEWSTLGLSGVLAIGAVAAADRPVRKTQWLVLAWANLSLTMSLLAPVWARTDLFRPVICLLYAIGLVSFVPWQPGRDRPRLVGGVILLCGPVLVSCLGLSLSRWPGTTATAGQHGFVIACLLADVLVLTMLVRLLCAQWRQVPGTTRGRAAQLVAAGSAGMLASGIVAGLIWTPGIVHLGTIAELGWTALYGWRGTVSIQPRIPMLRLAGESLVAVLMITEVAFAVSRRADRTAGATTGTTGTTGNATGALVPAPREITSPARPGSTPEIAGHGARGGLVSRSLLRDQIARELTRQRPEARVTGVLLMDLDDFHVLTGTMGQATGDELVAAAGARLMTLAGDCGIAAWLGGGTYALLVWRAADPAEAECLAERVVRLFREPFGLSAGHISMTATVGIATTQDTKDATDAEQLLDNADLALHEAKAAGKQQWRRYRPAMRATLVRRLELQTALQDAVASSAFTLSYQAIVELASDELAGFEALLRSTHSRLGTMDSSQFIALAEETGYMLPIGSWVLSRAVAETVLWQRAHDHPAKVYVSVNVSAHQFRDPGFFAGVRRVLDESGLAPSSLVLELTESVPLHHDDWIRCGLMKLRAMGVRIAIDDFGTGYSSLGYLRDLPVDMIKIDRSFVAEIIASKHRRALVQSIFRIARRLRLEVIAEGIETEAQRDMLMSMGCQFGQGYLLGAPQRRP